MKIAKKLFQTVCLAALFLSAGFLDLPYGISPNGEQKAGGRAEGNFPEPEAPGASGSLKRKTNQLEENARWLR